MNFYKVDVYDSDSNRECINILCVNCIKEVSKEFRVENLRLVYSRNERCYWCDNCLEGSDHRLFERKMKENKKRKGY